MLADIRTDGRTDPDIEMRGRIYKEIVVKDCSAALLIQSHFLNQLPFFTFPSLGRLYIFFPFLHHLFDITAPSSGFWWRSSVLMTFPLHSLLRSSLLFIHVSFRLELPLEFCLSVLLVRVLLVYTSVCQFPCQHNFVCSSVCLSINLKLCSICLLAC